MKAFVDQELCISCGLCTDEQPEVFFTNDDDKAEAIKDELNEKQIEMAKQAVENCPVEAIKVEC